MKKLFIILAAVTAVTLIGVAAVWACCGQSTFPLEILNIAVAPNPVPCIDNAWEPVTISLEVVVGQTMWPEPGYELDLDTYATVYINGTAIAILPAAPPAPGWGMEGTYAASATWTPPAAGTYSLLIEAYTIDSDGYKINIISEPGPDIVVQPCCIEGISVRITPETFNVQRAGNWVMGHVTLPEGAPAVTGGTIISIGGIACSIPGMAAPGEPIKFSSEAFSAIAEQIVPADGDRAEEVEVVVVTDLADGTVGCKSSDEIDIINEGKKNK